MEHVAKVECGWSVESHDAVSFEGAYGLDEMAANRVGSNIATGTTTISRATKALLAMRSHAFFLTCTYTVLDLPWQVITQPYIEQRKVFGVTSMDGRSVGGVCS